MRLCLVHAAPPVTWLALLQVPGAHPITIHFTANTADTMPWKFEPQQRTIKVRCPVCLAGGGHVGSRDAWMQVVPGEPALACYTAYNPTKRPITGVATYNVTPQKCGVYFTKYQCFCFDEQRLRPKEEIDMPVGGCSLIRWITAQFGDTHRCFSDSCYSGWTRRFWRIPSWETYAISRCPTPSSRRMKKMRKMTVVTTPSPSLLLASSA